MHQNKDIDVYLITGFLGAGKTTLINNIIQNNSKLKIGVIVNEFGQVGIDGSLISKDGIDLYEINNGSIFCSCLQATFSKALIEFSKLPIDVMLVEGSGLSDPSNMDLILESIKDKTYSKLVYKGNVCLVDALNIIKLMQASQIAVKQVMYGDYIIINKADLADKDMIDKAVNKITSVNPYASIDITHFARVDDVLNTIYRSGRHTDAIEQSCNTPSNRPPVFYIKSEHDFDKSEFKHFIYSIAEHTFRIKGFFKLNGGWEHIDAVNKELTIKPVNIHREFSQLIIFPDTKEQVIREIQQMCSEFFADKAEMFIKK